MRIEKKIRDAKRKDEDRAAQKNKALAEEVLGLLQNAWAGRGSAITGDSEPERLACVLTFLMTKVKESLANEAPLAPPDDPRTILAQEAARMFEDIVFNQDKHLIHDFFAGLKKVPKGYPLADGPAKGGRPTDSLDIHKGAILAACMKRAKEVGLSKDIKETDILATMSRNQDLSPYFKTTSAARSLIDRTESDVQLVALISNYYRAIKARGGETVSSVVDAAAFLVGLRHKPLSMDEALKVRPINIVIAKPESFEPETAKDLFQVLASGQADLRLVEREGGGWRVEVIEKGTGGYGSVGMGRIRQEPAPALPAPQERQKELASR